jgi:hypothetical protein
VSPWERPPAPPRPCSPGAAAARFGAVTSLVIESVFGGLPASSCDALDGVGGVFRPPAVALAGLELAQWEAGLSGGGWLAVP